MEKLWIYGAVLAGFGILFIASRGFFGAAGHLINRRFLESLGLEDKVVGQALAVLFAANILGCLLTVNAVLTDTVAQGYLPRENYGGVDYEENLSLTMDGETREITVDVLPRAYTEAEIEAILDAAEAALPAAVLGGQDPGHVSADLTFPALLPDLPVSLSYMVDKPAILDWDGRIGEKVPEAGAEVTVSADICFEERVRETFLKVKVFPRKLNEEERLTSLIRESIAARNDASDERLYLPEEIDGQEVAWAGNRTDAGRVFLGLGVVISLMMILTRLERRREAEEKRREGMLLDYPHIVGKLTLLVSAGMSLRMAFEKMGEDYRKSLAAGGARREGFEEILRVTRDMANGIPELQSYANMGRRSPEARYKSLATLLSQNLRRGSGEMVRILEREAAEAFDERRKQARIQGEKAGTKLTFPMFILLAVVMVILMVPAFASF